MILHTIVVYAFPKPLKKKFSSCAEIAQKLESPEKLNPQEKKRLKLHLFICNCCYDYKQQIELIQQTLKGKEKTFIFNPEKIYQEMKAPKK